MKKALPYVVAFLVLLLVLVPVFYKLGELSVRRWDEARNAANALEMYYNHNYLVRHFLKAPDIFETKPPMLTWLQVLSFYVCGINTFALRLPSALAVLGTCLLMFRFLQKEFKLFYAGLIAGFVLVTCNGYMLMHGGRTGDHEALLCFATTGMLLSAYRFLQHRQSTYVIAATIFLVIGSLTKSIAPLLFVPGLLICVFISRSYRSVLKDYRLYFAIAAYIAVLATYYLLRETQNPGYIHTAWQEELLPRYISDNRNKTDVGFSFYIIKMQEWQFSYWPLVLLFCLYPLFKSARTQKITVFLGINMLAFFLVISSGNKNGWYDYPLAPLMAVLIGLGLTTIWKSIPQLSVVKPWTAVLLVVLICIKPYQSVVNAICHQGRYDDAAMQYPDFLEKIKGSALAQEHIRIVDDGITPHFRFYELLVNKEWHINADFKYDPAALHAGDVVMTSTTTADSLATRFHTDVLQQYKDCVLVRLKQKN